MFNTSVLNDTLLSHALLVITSPAMHVHTSSCLPSHFCSLSLLSHSTLITLTPNSSLSLHTPHSHSTLLTLTPHSSLSLHTPHSHSTPLTLTPSSPKAVSLKGAGWTPRASRSATTICRPMEHSCSTFTSFGGTAFLKQHVS